MSSWSSCVLLIIMIEIYFCVWCMDAFSDLIAICWSCGWGCCCYCVVIVFNLGHETKYPKLPLTGWEKHSICACASAKVRWRLWKKKVKLLLTVYEEVWDKVVPCSAMATYKLQQIVHPSMRLRNEMKMCLFLSHSSWHIHTGMIHFSTNQKPWQKRSDHKWPWISHV